MAALKKDMDDAIAAIGKPPALEFDIVSLENAETEFDGYIDAYRRHLMNWRVEILGVIPSIEKVFIETRESGGDEALRLVVPEVIGPIKDNLAAAIERAERNCRIPEEVQANLDFASRVNPELAKIAASATRRFQWATQSYCESLYDIRDRLEALEWDHDPDAKGGPVFESADDLLASL